MDRDHGTLQRLELRLGGSQLDDAIGKALADASRVLGTAISQHLRDAGHEPALHVLMEKDRIMLGSTSTMLCTAETGTASHPPCPLMEEAARRAAPLAARALVHALNEMLG